VPEGRHVFPTLSVYDNLLMGACQRRDRNETGKSAEFIYELFGVLKERRRQLAGTLSGGEQQMLAIGRALMGNPQLLLLDEPSMGLAPLVVEHIFEALVTLNRGGLTLLMVEQNAEMALSIADHAVVLQTGSVALSGPAAELQKDERVRGLYLGSKQPVDSVIH
jgi:branched-chain amino acid transport system ATP-binding protein